MIDTSYYHLTEGLKNCLTQNKEIFQVIYDVKNEQKQFYKETREQLNELLEKINQLMIPENSYRKVCIICNCFFTTFIDYLFLCIYNLGSVYFTENHFTDTFISPKGLFRRKSSHRESFHRILIFYCNLKSIT